MDPENAEAEATKIHEANDAPQSRGTSVASRNEKSEQPEEGVVYISNNNNNNNNNNNRKTIIASSAEEKKMRKIKRGHLPARFDCAHEKSPGGSPPTWRKHLYEYMGKDPLLADGLTVFAGKFVSMGVAKNYALSTLVDYMWTVLAIMWEAALNEKIPNLSAGRRTKWAVDRNANLQSVMAKERGDYLKEVEAMRQRQRGDRFKNEYEHLVNQLLPEEPIAYYNPDLNLNSNVDKALFEQMHPDTIRRNIMKGTDASKTELNHHVQNIARLEMNLRAAEQKIENLKKEITTLQNVNEKLKGLIEKMTAKGSGKGDDTSKCIEMEVQLEVLRGEISKFESRIRDLEDQLSTSVNEKTQLQERIAEKEKQIEELGTTLASLKEQMGSQKREGNAKSKDIIDQMKQDFAAQQNIWEGNLAEKDKLIEDLQAKLALAKEAANNADDAAAAANNSAELAAPKKEIDEKTEMVLRMELEIKEFEQALQRKDAEFEDITLKSAEAQHEFIKQIEQLQDELEKAQKAGDTHQKEALRLKEEAVEKEQQIAGSKGGGAIEVSVEKAQAQVIEVKKEMEMVQEQLKEVAANEVVMRKSITEKDAIIEDQVAELTTAKTHIGTAEMGFGIESLESWERIQAITSLPPEEAKVQMTKFLMERDVLIKSEPEVIYKQASATDGASGGPGSEEALAKISQLEKEVEQQRKKLAKQGEVAEKTTQELTHAKNENSKLTMALQELSKKFEELRELLKTQGVSSAVVDQALADTGLTDIHKIAMQGKKVFDRLYYDAMQRLHRREQLRQRIMEVIQGELHQVLHVLEMPRRSSSNKNIALGSVSNHLERAKSTIGRNMQRNLRGASNYAHAGPAAGPSSAGQSGGSYYTPMNVHVFPSPGSQGERGRPMSSGDPPREHDYCQDPAAAGEGHIIKGLQRDLYTSRPSPRGGECGGVDRNRINPKYLESRENREAQKKRAAAAADEESSEWQYNDDHPPNGPRMGDNMSPKNKEGIQIRGRSYSPPKRSTSSRRIGVSPKGSRKGSPTTSSPHRGGAGGMEYSGNAELVVKPMGARTDETFMTSTGSEVHVTRYQSPAGGPPARASPSNRARASPSNRDAPMHKRHSTPGLLNNMGPIFASNLPYDKDVQFGRAKPTNYAVAKHENKLYNQQPNERRKKCESDVSPAGDRQSTPTRPVPAPKAGLLGQPLNSHHFSIIDEIRPSTCTGGSKPGMMSSARAWSPPATSKHRSFPSNNSLTCRATVAEKEKKERLERFQERFETQAPPGPGGPGGGLERTDRGGPGPAKSGGAAAGKQNSHHFSTLDNVRPATSMGFSMSASSMNLPSRTGVGDPSPRAARHRAGEYADTLHSPSCREYATTPVVGARPFMEDLFGNEVTHKLGPADAIPGHMPSPKCKKNTNTMSNNNSMSSSSLVTLGTGTTSLRGRGAQLRGLHPLDTLPALHAGTPVLMGTSVLGGPTREESPSAMTGHIPTKRDGGTTGQTLGSTSQDTSGKRQWLPNKNG